MKRILFMTAVALVAFAGVAWGAASITGRDVKNSSLTGKDIKNRSLQKADLSRSAVRSLRGSRGPQGPAGAVGPVGPAGPVNLGGIVRVESPQVVISPGDVDHATASCPAGYGLISGGYSYISADGEVFYEDDFGSHNSWSVGGDNLDSSVTGELTAIAYCAPSGKAVAARVGKSQIERRAAARDAALRAVKR